MQQLTKIASFVLILLVFGFVGCEGPSGSEGPQGPEGPEGQVGPAGEDGSVILAGKGAPSDDLGSNGDYYLDQNTGELYGPKNDQGWGTPISLQGPPGPDGQDGEDGSQIYSGTGAPAASLGVEGDYYLDKSNYELYGPKSDNGWGTPISLKGTANVLYSSWIDVSWDGGGAYGRYMRISESRITEAFLNKGAIQMYMKQVGSSGYSISPLSIIDADHELFFSAALSTDPQQPFNGIILQLDHISGQAIDQSAIDYFADQQVRYVLIPGGASVSKTSRDLPVNLDNYEEVKKYYGIRN